ncbi:MAG: HipA domain-containing protein [Alteromonadaceae bacterium]|nr:HipA domain-containing protein [Alteromonadaceae bacterium]
MTDYCKGTLTPITAAKSSEYTTKCLKNIFGLNSYPKSGIYIKGTNDTFEKYAIDFTNGNSISGVQRKLLMNHENGSFHPVNHNGKYIVKPSSKRLPHIAENEHAIMLLAKAIGLIVADCALVPFEDGELAYVTKRFDIIDDNTRLFIEDAASLCEVHPKHKGDDSLSYENTLITLFQASGNNQLVLLNGFRQILFAYIVGNNDLHLKNFSMYREPNILSNIMKDFTPIYDILSVAPYKEYDNEPLTLSLLSSELNGEFSSSHDQYGYYTLHDFVLLGVNIGFTTQATKAYINKMIKAVAKHAPVILSKSFCSEDHKTLILSRIEDRLECLGRPIL